jgi:ubiquinone biosynthesis protein UbiJ
VERLDEIKQRMADASPGPWHVKTANFGDAKTDAEFIAHAPADLAWAIAEIERLKREMAEMEARHEDVVRDEIGWALMGEDL